MTHARYCVPGAATLRAHRATAARHCATLCDTVRPCANLCDPVRQCSTMPDPVRPWLALFDFVRPCATLFGPLRPCSTLCNPVRPCAILDLQSISKSNPGSNRVFQIIPGRTICARQHSLICSDECSGSPNPGSSIHLKSNHGSNHGFQVIPGRAICARQHSHPGSNVVLPLAPYPRFRRCLYTRVPPCIQCGSTLSPLP